MLGKTNIYTISIIKEKGLEEYKEKIEAWLGLKIKREKFIFFLKEIYKRELEEIGRRAEELGINISKEIKEIRIGSIKTEKAREIAGEVFGIFKRGEKEEISLNMIKGKGIEKKREEYFRVAIEKEYVEERITKKEKEMIKEMYIVKVIIKGLEGIERIKRVNWYEKIKKSRRGKNIVEIYDKNGNKKENVGLEKYRGYIGEYLSKEEREEEREKLLKGIEDEDIKMAIRKSGEEIERMFKVIGE